MRATGGEPGGTPVSTGSSTRTIRLMGVMVGPMVPLVGLAIAGLVAAAYASGGALSIPTAAFIGGLAGYSLSGSV